MSFVAVVFSTPLAYCGELARARDQMLGLFENADIVVFGEDHYLLESRELLAQVLKTGVSAHGIDGFSTEYVIDEIEDKFQNYLRDPLATPNSQAEIKFFMLMAARHLRWPNDETNRNFFRLLRELKLSYGDKIAICGNDSRGELSGRDQKMGEYAAKCLINSKRAIVHVGALHAYSVSRSTGKGEHAAASQVLGKNLPQRRVVTLFHAQCAPDPEVQESDVLLNATKRVTSLLGKSLAEPTLYRTSEMPEKIRKINLFGARFDAIWDFAIVGQKGTYAPLDNLENRYGFDPTLFTRPKKSSN